MKTAMLISRVKKADKQDARITVDFEKDTFLIKFAFARTELIELLVASAKKFHKMIPSRRNIG